MDGGTACSCIRCNELVDDCDCVCTKCDEYRKYCACNYGFDVGDIRPQDTGRQTTFTGTPGGDMECFCWVVTKEEHLRFFGQAEHDDVIREHVTSYGYQRHEELGEDTGEPFFTIYPSDIIRACGKHDHGGKPLKVTVTIEEVD